MVLTPKPDVAPIAPAVISPYRGLAQLDPNGIYTVSLFGKMPGASAFTRIPYPARKVLIDFAKCVVPALLVEYAKPVVILRESEAKLVMNRI